MMDDALLNQLPERAVVSRGAKLSDYTTFRLGGACPALIDCPDAQSLAETVKLLHDQSVEFIVLGQGSNLLVSDSGVDSVVLRYCAENAPDVQFDDDRVRVSGNTLLDDLVQLTIEHGVGDLSFCSGIPGTVGGAIVGNAGAFGRQIGDVVESVQLLDASGRQHEVSADELGFGYRSSILKQTEDIVLYVLLKLQPEDAQAMEKERGRIMDLRKAKHPDWRTMPCAGSVFRNIEPTSAAERRQAAGWFLEEAGAKDFRVGGAHLFEKHANIIITDTGATARDVFDLMKMMIAAVQEKFGFVLEREVKLLGDFGQDTLRRKEKIQDTEGSAEPVKPRRKGGEERPMTTDERASAVIVSFYMVLFCLCTFIFWDSLVLKIIGATTAVGGIFLFVAAFFNTEGREKSDSVHPLRSYLLSVFITLMVLFVIRFLAGTIDSVVWSAIIVGAGLLVALVVFRKALVQVATTLLAAVFLFVTISNWDDVLVGRMKFKDVARQCGHLVFQIGPIQDVANLLLAGNYVGYLSRIDYHDKQIHIMATRIVADTHDDERLKTHAILDFVSNEINYISDPGDGIEFAKDPVSTLIAGGGDCEDQTLLLCSMLETVGVKTYIAFTDEHVFALVRFSHGYRVPGVAPYLFIDGMACYALDASDPGASIGDCAVAPHSVKRIFDVRRRAPVTFSIFPEL